MTNGWQVYRIGDLLTQNSNNVKVAPDKSYKLLGISLEGRGAFLREEKTGDSISATTLSPVHAGDFIYSRLFAWRGAFDVVPEELVGCFVSNEFPTFKINTEILLPKFLRLYFNRKIVWEEVEKYCTGTTKASRNRFKEQFFLGMEITLPPLTEQRRIVAHTESLAAQVNEAHRLREEANNEGSMLLSRATTFAIDEQNWEIRKLESVIKESPRNGLAPQAKVGSDGKKMLRINAVSSAPDRYVDLSAFNLVDVTEEVAKPFYMQNNEVFVVRYNGDINRLAKAAIYKAKDDEKVIYPDKLIRLRANEEFILPDYLVYALGSKKVRNQIEELGKTTAGNLGISGSNIKSFMIPVPPLDEQRRIVTYLDNLQAKVNALRELQSASGEELSALMPSILDKAFKGEL